VKQAEELMARISRKIHTSKNGTVAGHWSRAEKKHRRLHKMYPTDPYCKMVGDGISFTMSDIPAQPRLPQPRLQQQDLRILTLCVMNWATSGLAQPITRLKWSQFEQRKRKLFFLHLFLVKKLHKEGYYARTRNVSNVLDVWRPCLNAKPLNPYMLREFYKQSSDPEIDATIVKDTFMVRTDVWGAFTQFELSDAPLHSAGSSNQTSGPASRPHGLTSSRDLCCFKIDHCLEYAKSIGWAEAVEVLQPAAHCGMQATVGMFGMSPMPVLWQKPYRRVNEYVQTKGVKMVTVMDDNMANNPCPLQLLRHLETLVDVHIYFGLALSMKEKEALIPSRVSVFNGFLYCTAPMIKACPPAKLDSLMWVLRQLLKYHASKKQVSGSFLARVAGQLADATKAMFGVRLFTQGIMQNLKTIVKAPVDQPLNRKALFSQTGRVTKDAAADAEHLLHRKLAKLNGKMLIHGQRTDQQVTTDWSGYGWGAVLHPTSAVPNPPILSVQFPTSWRTMWSGSGETLTGGWAVMAYGNAYAWNNCLVLLCMDNVFAICTYNKMGSKDKDINKEMEFFWAWCRKRRITTAASYASLESSSWPTSQVEGAQGSGSSP
jgi:hypothetical protein